MRILHGHPRRSLLLTLAASVVAPVLLAGCGSCGGGLVNAPSAFMTLDTAPRAAVSLDGELIGNTPLRKYAIEPGDHEVVLECVPCPVAQSRTLTFTVEPREIYTNEATVFEMGSEGAGIPVNGGSDGGGSATLTANSKPWSVVFLDGALLGNTPMLDRSIESGFHTLVFKCGPCGDNAELTEDFFVESGQSHVSVSNLFDESGDSEPFPSVAMDHREEPTAGGVGHVRIDATPWAKVSLDGKPIGNTPIAGIEIEVGSHKATLECGPCEDPQTELFLFSVAAGDTYSIQATFE